MKTALITGASGQDAYFLSKLLLEKGYKIVATQRRSARPPTETICELLKNKNYTIVEADVTDIASILNVIRSVRPNEFYHLAAQSAVGYSFHQPLATIDSTGMGAINCLEAIRIADQSIKFYFAGSSEMFGDTHDLPSLNENSPMQPRSPYAAAKLLGYHMTKIYRESYGIYACSGILFNHESYHRGEYFVTRKITKGVAAIRVGRQEKIRLGNIDSMRDWGFAGDYMKAAWLMLQQKQPDDYVVATGEPHTIKDVLKISFEHVGIKNWENYVEVNTKENIRPYDVTRLIGDSSKAREILKWQPKYTFEKMIKEMVDYDILRMTHV